VATEPLGHDTGCNRVLPEQLGRAVLDAPRGTGKHLAAVAVVPDSLALAQSRTRHPSSVRHVGPGCAACGPSSARAMDATSAVRQLVTLARGLLDGSVDKERWRYSTRSLPWASLQRVALLRDEFHVTANRVARFGFDEHPIVDPVRIAAPTAASAVLAPGQLVFQLDLAAGRLIALLDDLTLRDWTRTCRMGDRIVTLGELVDGLLDEAVDDLLDLLQTVPEHESNGAAALLAERGPLDRRDANVPALLPVKGTSRDGAAW
jgi:hypothetical protein